MQFFRAIILPQRAEIKGISIIKNAYSCVPDSDWQALPEIRISGKFLFGFRAFLGASPYDPTSAKFAELAAANRLPARSKNKKPASNGA